MKPAIKEKFKGYELVDAYPEDGWLKGYFYAVEEDIASSGLKLQKAYQDLGSIRHRDYILHLLGIKNGERVLDVGCSIGALMVYCGLLGAEVYGVDISGSSIEKANLYLKKYQLGGKAVVCDARKLNFADNYFDKVVSSDFFEHMTAQDNLQVLKEIRRVLKPGGLCVIRTPNLTYLKYAKLFKMLKRLFTFKNPFAIVIPQTQGEGRQHIGLLTKKQLLKIIQRAGFLNFRFYSDRNSRIEKINYGLAQYLAENHFLSGMFSEDLIVALRKPIILSFFP